MTADQEGASPRDAAAEIRDQTGPEEGDAAAFEVDDGLAVPPVRAVPRSRAWFWTPEWQAAEREADADRAAGRVTRYGSDEEFLSSLGEARRHAVRK